MFNIGYISKEFFTNKFWKYVSINAATLVFTTLINFGVSLYLLRNISLADYGVYSSLFAVSAFLVVAAPGLQLYFTKLGAYLKSGYPKQDIFRYFFKYSFVIACTFCLMSLLMSRNRLQLVGISPQLFSYAWFVLGISIITLLQGLVDGMLRGLHHFTLLGISSIICHFIKAIGILWVIVFSFSLQNILLAILLSVSFVYIFELLALWKISKKYKLEATQKKTLLMPNIAKLTLTALLISNFTNIELLFSRAFLDPVTSGLFAAQINLSKVVLLGSSIITPVLYSLVSESVIQQNSKAKKTTLHALVLLVCFGLGVAFLLKVFNRSLFTLLFHKGIDPAYDISWVMALGYVLYGASDLIIHRLLAHNRSDIFGLLMGVNVFEMLLLIIFHGNIWQFTWVAVATQLLLLVGSIIFSLISVEPGKWWVFQSRVIRGVGNKSV